MSEPVVLRAEQRDLSALLRLWEDVFGDPPEMIETFFRYFSPEKSGWVVKRDDCLCSAAYLLTGNILSLADGSLPAGYVYAVATVPEERGKGYAGMLMQRISEYAAERGFILYTRPASERLFGWYGKTLRTDRVSRMTETMYLSDDAVSADPVSRIDPASYGIIREKRLMNRAHVVLSDPFLCLQDCFSDGFYAVGDGAACCMLKGNALYIPELLCPDEQCSAAVQSLIRFFDADSAILRRQQPNGDSPLVAFSGDDQHAKTDWGLLLE